MRKKKKKKKRFPSNEKKQLESSRQQLWENQEVRRLTPLPLPNRDLTFPLRLSYSIRIPDTFREHWGRLGAQAAGSEVPDPRRPAPSNRPPLPRSFQVLTMPFHNPEGFNASSHVPSKKTNNPKKKKKLFRSDLMKPSSPPFENPMYSHEKARALSVICILRSPTRCSVQY